MYVVHIALPYLNTSFLFLVFLLIKGRVSIQLPWLSLVLPSIVKVCELQFDGNFGGYGFSNYKTHI